MGNPTSTSTPTPPKKPEDETVLGRIYEGDAGESTDSNIRYAGYAYTSDIGESFRPVAHPWLVRGAYGVSWAYITGDVGYEGYKAYLNNKAVLAGLPPPHPSSHHHSSPPPASTTTTTTPPTKIPFLEDYRTLMVQRFIFQAVASMALPAFTIHSVVRYSGRAMKNVKNARLRTWGPVGLGLAVVPALPYLFDEPVEKGVEKVFEVLAGTVEGAGKGTADKEVVKHREL